MNSISQNFQALQTVFMNRASDNEDTLSFG